jgi:hypothetical protein
MSKGLSTTRAPPCLPSERKNSQKRSFRQCPSARQANGMQSTMVIAYSIGICSYYVSDIGND